MPIFFATPSNDDPLHRPAYEIEILGPQMDANEPQMRTAAFIIETLYPDGFKGCSISKELAREYDPTVVEGEVLPIVFVSEDIDPETGVQHVDNYVIGFPVKFISGKRRLIRISTHFLLSMFDISKHPYGQGQEDNQTHYLRLELRRCVRFPEKPPGGGVSDIPLLA